MWQYGGASNAITPKFLNVRDGRRFSKNPWRDRQNPV
jgi:hypothetical protein